ncbi:YciI family protein [Kibdelosporangium lantanae]|uniref:YciI family protein n=1 Tax=Kibdelosporangium lantanae TaxID=1497396 RepID=A0ABW3MJD9_9PSEU
MTYSVRFPEGVRTVGSIPDMAWFTVDTTYVEDRDKLMEVRPKHRDYLRELVGRGEVLVAGPWAHDRGGFVIYQVDDRAHLDRLLADDPYTTQGVAANRVVEELNITLGAWLPQ